MSKTRVLFCGLEFPGGIALSKVRLPGFDMQAVDRSQVPAAIEKIRPHVVVPLMYKLERNLILKAASQEMKMIHQFGAGLEGVDLEAAKEAGIPVLNIPAAASPNAISCGEHSIFLALSLLRQAGAMERALSNRMLGNPMGGTIMGKNVLVLGFGAIGKEVAHRFSAFGARVAAYRSGPWAEADRALVDDAGSSQEDGPDKLLEMAGSANILVVCTPLTASTRGMVNSKVLGAMPPGGIVINVARGGIVDRDSIIKGLSSGHVGGYGTDVFWGEPFDPCDEDQGGVTTLRRLLNDGYNIALTPHVAGVTQESYAKMADVFCANLAVAFSPNEAWH